MAALRVELSNDGAAWVSAGQVVRSGDVNREGFRPELDEIRPGTMTLTVSNQTRAWDPEYAASPLAGYLDAGDYIRLIYNVGGVDYTVFTGVIDRLSQQYDPGNHDATAVVEAVDATESLAQRPLPSGFENVVDYVSDLYSVTPIYLPLNEPTEVLYTSNPFQLSAFSGVWAGTPIQSTDVMPSAPGGKQFALCTAGIFMPPFTATAGGDWSLSFWISVPKLNTGAWVRRLLQPARIMTGAESSGDVVLTLDSSGGMVLYQSGSAGFGTVFQFGLGPSGNWVLADGRPHHIAIEVDAGVGITVYVDGAQNTPTVSTNPTRWKAISSFTHYWGGDYLNYQFGVPGTVLVDDQSIALGHIVQMSGGNLFSPRLAVTGYTGSINDDSAYWDTPGERVEWVLDKAGVTAGTINTTTTLLRGVRGGDLPIDHLRRVAASDGGMFWIDADGEGQYRSPLSGGLAAEFKDDVPGLGYSGSDPVRDRSRRITAARATVEGTAVARYDTGRTPIREAEFEVLNLIPTDAYARCVAVVDERKDIGSVYPSLTFQPARDNRWSTALTLDLSQWVRVKRTPVGIGPAINVAARIEGIRHSFGDHPSTWTTTLSLGIPTTTDFFILDSSLLNTGRLA